MFERELKQVKQVLLNKINWLMTWWTHLSDAALCLSKSPTSVAECHNNLSITVLYTLLKLFLEILACHDIEL